METCLKVTSLSKNYDSLPVLDNWDLEIKKGERLAIIGQSGCGKTTFLNLVAHLELPTLGDIEVCCRKMAYVFQEPRLIPWKTVRENVLFVQPDGGEKEILHHLGLKGFENYYPAQLSGGMAQRVNLARALITNPDLLILDEAFLGLDLGNKYRIIQSLNDLWQKKHFTMLSVAHNPKDALLLANRIVIVSKRPSRIIEEYEVHSNECFNAFSPALAQAEMELTRKILDNQ